MRIFLTGASGLLGGNFAEVAGRNCHEVAGIVGGWEGPAIPGLAKQSTVDLTDQGRVVSAVREFRPDAIVNCAAVSDPARCDQEPTVSRVLNVGLPGWLAAIAAETGARLVHVSSEQVFDGRHAPYRVGDPVSPITLYGRQKVESERVVLEGAPGLAAAVRVPLLMGNSPSRRRSVHERLLRDWTEGRTSRLFTDEVRQVCMADNLAAVLLELCEAAAPSGVLHWAGAEPVSRYAMGAGIAARFGLPAGRLITPAQLAGTPLAATRQADLSMNLAPLSLRLLTKPEPFAAQLERMQVPPDLVPALEQLRRS